MFVWGVERTESSILFSTLHQREFTRMGRWGGWQGREHFGEDRVEKVQEVGSKKNEDR